MWAEPSVRLEVSKPDVKNRLQPFIAYNGWVVLYLLASFWRPTMNLAPAAYPPSKPLLSLREYRIPRVLDRLTPPMHARK